MQQGRLPVAVGASWPAPFCLFRVIINLNHSTTPLGIVGYYELQHTNSNRNNKHSHQESSKLVHDSNLQLVLLLPLA